MCALLVAHAAVGRPMFLAQCSCHVARVVRQSFTGRAPCRWPALLLADRQAVGGVLEQLQSITRLHTRRLAEVLVK